ncbi:MAG: FkbM family methyltransferase [Lutisporaceae bacterium]
MVERFSIDIIEKDSNEQLQALQKRGYLSSSNIKPIIFFGAGLWGVTYLEATQQITPIPILFCDNDSRKWGTIIEGVSVISFDELKDKYYDSAIVITSPDYYNEIEKQLEDNNMHDNLLEVAIDVFFNVNFNNYFSLVDKNLDKFSRVYSWFSDDYSKQLFYDKINYCISANPRYLVSHRSKAPQYFDPDIVTLSQDETFVDGGAFIGDTVDEIIKQTKGIFKKIYSFEPEKTKHLEFLEKFSSLRNVELVPYGLWEKKGILRFNSSNSGYSRVSEEGDIEIPVISVDEVLNGEVVTFIKMDIEGAELKALKGAEKTIKKYRPRLAICIYHKPLDIIEIPYYIKELVPEYKFYLRHYSSMYTETVLYAIAD